MTINASRVRVMLDSAPAALLRDLAAAAVTATRTETAIALNELTKAWWNDGTEIPYGVFQVAVNVTALDKTTGDETYALSLMIDDTSDLSDAAVTIATYPIPSIGHYVFYVDSKTLPLLDPDNSGLAKFLGIKATLGGTTPIITYGATLGMSVEP